MAINFRYNFINHILKKYFIGSNKRKSSYGFIRFMSLQNVLFLPESDCAHMRVSYRIRRVTCHSRYDGNRLRKADLENPLFKV